MLDGMGDDDDGDGGITGVGVGPLALLVDCMTLQQITLISRWARGGSWKWKALTASHSERNM